jgi:hypothetical protein
MGIRSNRKRAATATGNGLQEPAADEALRAGLTLILADAARSHLRAGDLDKASLCVEEAERCLGTLAPPSPNGHSG